MPENEFAEKDHRIALKAALVIEANGDALEAMLNIAIQWLQRGLTQEGVNLLAFVLHHPDIRHETYDRAEEIFLDLETQLCPRVIEDAKTFRLGKSINTVAAYVDQQV